MRSIFRGVVSVAMAHFCAAAAGFAKRFVTIRLLNEAKNPNI
jgi:hypothetical protein